jgi:hypothetical protein
MIKTVVQCSLCKWQDDAVKSPGIPPKAPRGWYTIDRQGLSTYHLCSAKCLLAYAQNEHKEALKK